MVDTVILEHSLIPNDIVSIINPATYDNWSPSLKGIVTPPYYGLGSGGFMKSVLNLSNKQLGVYAPKLTYYKRVVRGGFRHVLYIEFSAPKLLYGNNFEELTDNDFVRLCSRLSMTLKEGGVNLSANGLRKCSVKAIHYGKNIILSDNFMLDCILRYLSKANLSLKQQGRKTLYSDGGIAIHASTIPRAFCAYNKKKELISSRITEKGRLEDDSWCQMKMLDALNGIEVLRLELRLETKKAIRTELERHEIATSLSLPFVGLFSAKIAQKLLLAQLADMENRILPILKNESELARFTEQISALNPRIRLNTVALAVTLKTLTDEGKSMREIRELLRVTPQRWSDLMARMGNLNIPPPKLDYLADVKEQLEAFEPVRLERIKDLVYNN